MMSDNEARGDGQAERLEDRADAEAKEIQELVEPEDALPEATLDSLPPRLQEAVARAGWSKLMPVQAKAIPYLLAGRDLMVQSRTGSGKTGAFVLPMLERIDTSKPECQALVLAPTRELALQVAQEAERLAGDTGFRVAALYGGVAYEPQLAALQQGAHLVVGTPGRVLDHLLRKSLRLDGLRMLVFDEADRMLSMGFYPDMKAVQRYLPKRHVNGYMFSATFPPHVMRLAGEFLERPEILSLSRDHVHVTEVEHVFYDVPGVEKDRTLVRLIEIENPAAALIFCNTKAKVGFVTAVLQRFGYDADMLSSDLSQAARENVMARVRAGKLRFLVATDVAARGIDLPDLSHVVQYEVSEDHEVYIHRAGRTGRAGASGTAITLVTGLERIHLQNLARKYGIDLVERPLPTDEDVQRVVAERAIALLEAKLRDRDKLQVERMQRFLPLARELAESDDSLQALAMLIDDYYQEAMHGPPPAPPASPTPRPEPRRSDRRRRSGRSSRRRR